MAQEGMVDALKEARRVLVPGGQLIDMDITPVEARVAIEVDETRIDTGPLDQESSYFEDARAAGQAVAHLVEERLLQSVDEIEFDVVHRFASVDAMETYIAEEWERSTVEPATLERARMEWKEAGEHAKVVVFEPAVVRSLVAT